MLELLEGKVEMVIPQELEEQLPLVCRPLDQLDIVEEVEALLIHQELEAAVAVLPELVLLVVTEVMVLVGQEELPVLLLRDLIQVQLVEYEELVVVQLLDLVMYQEVVAVVEDPVMEILPRVEEMEPTDELL